MDDRELLGVVDQAFAAVERPEHFADGYEYDPSEEKDTDDQFRSRERNALLSDDVLAMYGGIGLLSSAGFQYFMPGLIRLALANEDVLRKLVGWRLSTPINKKSPPSHLDRTELFNRDQTAATLLFLQHVKRTRLKCFLAFERDERQLNRAIANWMHFLACFDADGRRRGNPAMA